MNELDLKELWKEFDTYEAEVKNCKYI